MREIDLGLDLRLAGTRAAISGSAGRALSGKVLAHTLGFVHLNRARVRLLLCHSDLGKDIEDSFALDFQFPGQIANPNFTHPPCVLSTIPLHDHHNPHETKLINSFVIRRKMQSAFADISPAIPYVRACLPLPAAALRERQLLPPPERAPRRERVLRRSPQADRYPP